LLLPAATAAEGAKPLQQHRVSYRRKLLQPYTLTNRDKKALLLQSFSGRMNEKKLNEVIRNVVAPGDLPGIPSTSITLLDCKRLQSPAVLIAVYRD
jgi:hypothetical protein